VLDQNLKQLVLVGREVDLLRVDADDALFKIDLDRAEMHQRARAVHAGGGPAQSCANPRQQLAHREGLGDVVIGAQVECGDFVFLLAAGGKHQDRDLAPFPDFLNHFQPVAIGQAKVEQNQIRLARCGLRETFLGRDRFLQAIAFGGESGAQEAADLGVVFDQEDEGLHFDSTGREMRKMVPPPSRGRA